jgi:Flp pilus assembly protein TadG
MNRRQGVATVWTILTVPVVLVGLAGVIELGHLWLVRNELQTSLESAALAGVKTWADLSEGDNHAAPGAFAKTSAARTAAQSTFAVNPIFGQTFTLNRNESNDGNNLIGYDNQTCAGDIVLGGFDNVTSTTFNVAAEVGCGRSTNSSFNATFSITVTTPMGQGSHDTSNAFRVSFDSTDFPGPGVLSITEFQINLRNIPDLNPGGVLQEDAAAVFDFGTIGSFVGNEAGGNGPAVDATSDVSAVELLSASGDGTSVLTLTFQPGAWTAGEELIFGVDTDNVESNGTLPNTVGDTGGDFGDTPGASGQIGRIGWSFGFNGNPASGNTISERLQNTMGGRTANFQGNSRNVGATIGIFVPDEEFAVLAQKTISVNPLMNNLFGVSLPSFNVSSRAIAIARCSGGNSAIVLNPQLVHVTGITCP